MIYYLDELKEKIERMINMFEEFDRVIMEEQENFNKMIRDTLTKQHEEFCAELDKLVSDSIEESHKETEEMLRENGFSEDYIKGILGNNYIGI